MAPPPPPAILPPPQLDEDVQDEDHEDRAIHQFADVGQVVQQVDAGDRCVFADRARKIHIGSHLLHGTQDSVCAGEIDAAIINGWPHWYSAIGLKLPDFLTRLRIDCIQIAIVAAKIGYTVGYRQRTTNFTLSLELPGLLSGLVIDRVRRLISTAEIDQAIGGDWLSINQVTDLEFPFCLPRLKIDRVQIHIPATKIDHAIGHGQRRINRAQIK